jgi:hypothetical protein
MVSEYLIAYDFIKIFGFDLIIEDLIGFSM